MTTGLTLTPVNGSTQIAVNNLEFAENHPAGWVLAKISGFPAGETNAAGLIFTADTAGGAAGSDGGRFTVVKVYELVSPGEIIRWQGEHDEGSAEFL